MKLDNKNIFVTGANRGIGAAIVKELLKHNVGKVYAAARKPETLPDFGDARVVPVPLDIVNPNQVNFAAQQAKDVHILINNAGTATPASIVEGSVEAIAADMNTNYFGTLNVIHAFTPILQKSGQGMIASVASVLSLAPIAVYGGYSASKAALHSAIQSARMELNARGIKVTGIYPGPIDTDMGRDMVIDKETPENAAQKIVAGIIADDEYIFPDAMSQHVGALWQTNPYAVEEQFSAMSTAKAA